MVTSLIVQTVVGLFIVGRSFESNQATVPNPCQVVAIQLADEQLFQFRPHLSQCRLGGKVMRFGGGFFQVEELEYMPQG